MNLKSFEEDFNSTILQRGKNYYDKGAVLTLEEISENEYSAEVEGSELYDVTVEMDDDGNIDDISCDCPYDMGGYCKHEAAVLYALRSLNSAAVKPALKKSNLSQLLGKCSKNQLAEIILEHSKEDKSFRNYLNMKLSKNSEPNSIISDFTHICNMYFKTHSDIDTVFKAVKLLKDKTENLSSSAEKVKVYTEIIFMLEKGIENDYNYYYDDEESWQLYEIINDCSSLIEDSVKKIADSQNQKDIACVWECLIKGCCEKFTMDDEEYFFPSLLILCRFPEYRSKLYEILQFNRMSADEYEKRKIDKNCFSIIEAYETETEINLYINSHLDNSYFRRIAIERAVNEKNYTRAEQLALEGISKDDNRFSFLSDGKKLLYDIYKLSGDTKKLTDICCDLIKDGNNNYYDEWKSLVPKENFSYELNRLLNEPKNYSYEYIISCENISDRIYDFCCEYPSKISLYYPKLKSTEFKEKSKKLYEKYIRNQGEHIDNRSEYAVFCEKLKRFYLECDMEIAEKIASDFRDLYRRRPAFIDELTKAGF